MAHNVPVSQRRALLLIIAGLLATGLIWWSPTVGSSTSEAEREARLHAEPDLTAARALAGLLADRVVGVESAYGQASADQVEATAFAGDLEWVLRIVLDPAAVEPGPCDSSGRDVAKQCRTLADGSVLEVSATDWCHGAPESDVLSGVLDDPRLDGGLTPELVEVAGDIDDFREQKDDELVTLSCTSLRP